MGKGTKLGPFLGVLASAVAVVGLGCGDQFTGPYPCVAGYASCNGNNACETQVSSDPRHCGACNQVCPQGGLCSSGTCTASPPVLSKVVMPGSLAINATTVFYSTADGTIIGLSKIGAAPLTFSPQNAQSNGNGISYAVDDTSVYYVGQISGSGPGIIAYPVVPIDGGTPTRVVATQPSSSGFSGSVQLAVAGDTLLILVNNGNQTLVAGVATSGGTIVTLATFHGMLTSSPIVDANGIYAVLSANQGPCEIDRAPSTGGDPSPIVQTSMCPSALATDGKNLYWANASNYGSNKGPMRCMLSVARAPVTGGNETTLATIGVDEVPLQIAADAANVYVATDQSLWKVPSDGGAVTRLAGNLGTPNHGGSCNQSMNNGNPVSLAVDDTTVYVAVGGANRGEPQALLAIPK